MPVRTRGAASAMPATNRSRSHAPVAVNVAAEEESRFGASHLTRVMREDLRRGRVPPPALLDPGDLAEAVRERDEATRRRHRDEDRRVQREYEAYLAGRKGQAMPEDDFVSDDDEEVEITGTGSVVPQTRNPVRDRLEREAAATRSERATRGTRSDALVALEAEADEAARVIRDAAPPRRTTAERLVARDPVDGREWYASDRDRESRLLTDAPAAEPDSNLTARQCTLADVDRLWDWIRTEPATGIRFIGRPLTNSQQLHALMTTIAKGEAARTSLARSIYLNDQHAGFVILLPIVMADKMAAVHMYLRAESRGLLPAMLPSLLELAHDVMPDVKLAVMGMPLSFGKLLEPYGFRTTIVFQQE